MFCSNNATKERFYFNDSFEVRVFLNNLEDDTVYVVTFDFIVSWLQYDDESPVINLSKPILITKNSCPILISKFIKNRLILACDQYFIDQSVLEYEDKLESPGILLNYSKINLF